MADLDDLALLMPRSLGGRRLSSIAADDQSLRAYQAAMKPRSAPVRAGAAAAAAARRCAASARLLCAAPDSLRAGHCGGGRGGGGTNAARRQTGIAAPARGKRTQRRGREAPVRVQALVREEACRVGLREYLRLRKVRAT